MSFGSSSTQTSTPNIPPSLQPLLSERTAAETAQLPSFAGLLSSAFGGGNLRTAPYGQAILAPYAAASARTGERLSRTIPGADQAVLTQAAQQQFGAAENQAESALRQNIFENFLAMAGAIPYPSGSETTTTKQPGLIDYLTTVANVVNMLESKGSKAAAA